MANRTVKDALNIKGTNPQHLVEKIIRTRIYDSRYWKEECFALTAELIVDKALEIRYIGGVYGGNVKPTPFLCVILKMLQIQPDKDIIIEFIKNEDFKYLRVLGAMYMRLTGSSIDCYKYVEPLYNDYRKLRYMNKDGKFELVHIDEFIDHLLRDDRYCDIILPRIQKRTVLEETENLEPRMSALFMDLEEDVGSQEDDKFKSHKRRSISPQKLKMRKKKHKRRSKSKSNEKDDFDYAHHRHLKDLPYHRPDEKAPRITKLELEEENSKRKKLGLGPLKL